jgi:tartrate-resistant acid phosphatase type 5
MSRIKRVAGRGHGRAAVAAALVVWPGVVGRAELPSTQPASADPRAVRLFAVGDWGIASPDRTAVGKAMADRANLPGHRPADVLLLGDNFYVKLTGIDDPQVRDFFELTYDPAALPVPFYAVLGNHDYKTNDAPIEMAYAARGHTRFALPAPWYRLDLPPGHPLVTVLMLDSDHDLMAPGQWDVELAWLRSELAKPHAPWLVAAAHHDMFGNGSHGDNGVLQRDWGTLFRRAGVALYLCGHEHTLQHLEIPGWPVSFVVAGGGGAGTRPMLRDARGPFSVSQHGFAELAFTPGAMSVDLLDPSGTVLHAFTRTPDGRVNVTVNSPSQKATAHPLRVINDVGGGKGNADKDAD